MSRPDRRDNLARTLSQASAWVLAGRIALAGCGFLLNIVLVRVMTPEDFGLYLLALSVVTLLIMGGQLGLQVSVVGWVARAVTVRGRDEPNDLALKMALLGLAGAVAVGVLFAAGGFGVVARVLDAPQLPETASVMVLWAVVAAPLGILAEGFRASGQYRPAALFGGLSSALILLFCVVPLKLSGQTVNVHLLLNLCAGASASSLLMALFHAMAGRKTLKLQVGTGSLALLRSSLPLMLMSLATMVTTQADLWVAGAFLPKADVAAYGVAARLVQWILLPLLVLNAALAPMIAQLHAQGAHTRLERVLGASAALGSLPGIAVLLLFFLFAGQILSTLYGETYARASHCLALLSAGQLINTCCGPAATVLMMCGRERAVMMVSLASAALSVIGAAVLAPHYGMEGIATAAGVAAAAHGLLCLWWVRRSLDLWTLPKFSGMSSTLVQLRSMLRRDAP